MVVTYVFVDTIDDNIELKIVSTSINDAYNVLKAIVKFPDHFKLKQ